jgi:predicted AlkP superfamily pyrophosphatase or phosphodiesterase
VRRTSNLRCWAFLVIAHLVACAPPSPELPAAERPIVILISLDGWRWDYLKRFNPPTLNGLAQQGVLADGLIPAFPSKTFPNHYTVVTGLYPGHHGIVSNTMRDPKLPGLFSLANVDVQKDPRWWQGTPLWVTVERQGQVAGTMFWPGSDVEIAGDRPTYWLAYDGGVPNNDRVDRLLSWLERPERERPTFLTLYFSEVDTSGHNNGPESPEIRTAVLNLDDAVGRLVRGVERAGLAPRTNYVIVSDHGMAQNSRDRVIVIDDYVAIDTVDLIDSNPILGVAPKTGTVDALYHALRGKHPALVVYRSSELPDKYRLRNHPRVPPVVGIADDGWTVMTRESLQRGREPGGSHGYDPVHRSMHGLFIATGPAFRTQLTVPAFDNIHVYELLCRVLRIKPESNDGNPAVTHPFLATAAATPRP